ncbi:hypothetical protein HRbin36_02380 [bacterium HR36]|nr:hypothetical protein HRbin36_02380 [bacterium HR36]
MHLRDAYGQPRLPLGYLPDPPVAPGQEVGGHLVSQGKVWAYIDGSCEVRLPPGRVTVEVWHGPAYAPTVWETDRGQGRIAIRVRLSQVLAPPPGWHWADTRVHFLSPAVAALEGAAEGLTLVHLLAARREKPLPRLANLLDFSGQDVLLQRFGCAVCVNTYQQGGVWGDLALLHCHRVVFPLTAGEPGFEHYTLADWAYQCHRKGGLVVWPGFPGSPGERLPLAMLGEIDAVEWCAEAPWDASTLELWYALLNAGRLLPVVGASGKPSNALAVGAVRTATWLGPVQPFSLANWVSAVKHGHTYATHGPILEWRINDLAHPWEVPPLSPFSVPLTGPGSMLTPSESPLPRTPNAVSAAAAATASPPAWCIVAHARSVTPFSRLEMICGGEVMASASASVVPVDNASVAAPLIGTSQPNPPGFVQHPTGVYCAGITWQLAATKLDELPGSWLAFRCWDGHNLAAHTSPISLPRQTRLRECDRERLHEALARAESVLVSVPHPRQSELLQRLRAARQTLRHLP